MDDIFTNFILWISSFTGRKIDDVMNEFGSDHEIIIKILNNKIVDLHELLDYSKKNEKKLMFISGYLRYRKQKTIK